MTPKRDWWTKDRFVAWLNEHPDNARIEPARVVACLCGDVNCRGWRLVRPEVDCDANV